MAFSLFSKFAGGRTASLRVRCLVIDSWSKEKREGFELAFLEKYSTCRVGIQEKGKKYSPRPSSASKKMLA
jgi:hypothetical protein